MKLLFVSDFFVVLFSFLCVFLLFFEICFFYCFNIISCMRNMLLLEMHNNKSNYFFFATYESTSGFWSRPSIAFIFWTIGKISGCRGECGSIVGSTL